MLKLMFKLLLVTGTLVTLLQADSTVEQALQQQTNYTISGSFSPYDFAPKGDNNPFDWAYTSASGTVYQLRGVAPTPKSVFGWKVVNTQSSAPRPAAPTWYMFRLNGDVDGDGSLRFDWVLVLASGNKAAYKLVGVRENGTFKYSEKLNIDYKIVGNTVQTAPSGTFSTADTQPENNDSVEENATDAVCITLPQEPVGQKLLLRDTKYYTGGSSRYFDIVHTLTSRDAGTTVTTEYRSGESNKVETVVTNFTTNGNYKDITKRILERTGLSSKTTTYSPYWREPFHEVCENQTWNFRVDMTTSGETTSENVTYSIVALHETKTVAGGTFDTIHIKYVSDSVTRHQWIDTTNGILIAEEIYRPDNSLQRSLEFLSQI